VSTSHSVDVIDSESGNSFRSINSELDVRADRGKTHPGHGALFSDVLSADLCSLDGQRRGQHCRRLRQGTGARRSVAAFYAPAFS